MPQHDVRVTAGQPGSSFSFSGTSIFCCRLSYPPRSWRKQEVAGVDLTVLLTERTRRAVWRPCLVISTCCRQAQLREGRASAIETNPPRTSDMAWRLPRSGDSRAQVSPVLAQGCPPKRESLTTSHQAQCDAIRGGNLSPRRANINAHARGSASPEALWRKARGEVMGRCGSREVRCHDLDGLPCTASSTSGALERLVLRLPGALEHLGD